MDVCHGLFLRREQRGFASEGTQHLLPSNYCHNNLKERICLCMRSPRGLLLLCFSLQVSLVAQTEHLNPIPECNVALKSVTNK